MSCPYFKEGYFGICVAPAPDAIHVPSIDEMERLCFRSWYYLCPNIAYLKATEDKGRSHASGALHELRPAQPAGPLSEVSLGGNTGGPRR